MARHFVLLALPALLLLQSGAASADDAERIERFAASLRIRTVSPQDPSDFDPAAFLAFHRFLADAFPDTHRALERETVAEYSLLYSWPGSDATLAPMLLTSHIDTVPVVAGSEDRWEYPAFEGAVADGYVWGRGAMDDKVGVLATLEAVEELVREGFAPKRTVYLAFGHDEELGGNVGAAGITELLRSRGVKLWFSLDEGMAIVEGMAGIKRPVAVVGVAEKGFLTLEITVKADGGHSSMPPPETAIGRLAEVVRVLEANPMPPHMDGMVGEMLDALGPELAGMRGFAVRNRWLFGPMVARGFSAEPATNAIVRTTTAVTMVRGGVKANVLPSRATLTANFRVHPGDSSDEIVERVSDLLADQDVDIEIVSKSDASDVADVNSDSYALLRDVVASVFEGVPTVPGLVLGGTDTKHYAQVAENGYRFTPVRIRQEDATRVHGIGERVAVDDYLKMPPFYVELIRRGAGAK
ncbi:MAG: M20/M25/M40 family metallo-hydrolase [Myxococcales bacterium]|nr:M20/M25/M40 family metallo-hydrolase [Myxococcales bacterium]